MGSFSSVVLVASFALTCFAGCARDAATVAPAVGKPLVGTWVEREPSGALPLRASFAPNGTYAIDVLHAGSRDVTGRYEMDAAGVLTLVESDESPRCPGARSEFAATVIDGELDLVRVRDTCRARGLSLARPWRRAAR
jgi:hypothetical protein